MSVKRRMLTTAAAAPSSPSPFPSLSLPLLPTTLLLLLLLLCASPRGARCWMTTINNSDATGGNGNDHESKNVTAPLPSATAPSPSESDDMDGGGCPLEVGFRRPGNSTFRLLFTSSNNACCDICRKLDRCQTWNRDDRTGACGLKSEVEMLVRDENFTSGVIGGSVAPDQVPAEFPCPQTRGENRPGANIAGARFQARNNDECCRACVADLRCFAWARNRRTGMCFLKERIQFPEENDNFVSGLII